MSFFKPINHYKGDQEMICLIKRIRALVTDRDYQQGKAVAAQALGDYPDAPEPHNLLGIIYEKTGDHIRAMKHFQAAEALDPTYVPARVNMERFARLKPSALCAFDESDCQPENNCEAYLFFDTTGVGHIARG